MVNNNEVLLNKMIEIGSIKCINESNQIYVPTSSWNSPSILPQQPLLHYITPSYYFKLSEDTLFFIFYNLPNTIQQELAIQELKRLSWRFHKKYSLWLQRNNEPIKITDSYEQGSYVYFDVEEWKRAIKPDFTFHYSFLE